MTRILSSVLTLSLASSMFFASTDSRAAESVRVHAPQPDISIFADDEADEADELMERSDVQGAAPSVTYYDIVSVLDPSNEMSIVYGTSMDYTLLTTWDRNSYTNQQFYLVGTTSGYYQIKARHSNLCLQPANSKLGNGVPVVQTTCNSAVTSQSWKVTVGSTTRIENKLKDASSNSFCMEILNGSTANGAPIGMNYCTTTNWQQFIITAAQ